MTRNWTHEQAAVLEHRGSGLAVMAGAGAGKTTVLVEKCARLLSERPDARICAVSFTEKSAADLRLKLSRFDLSKHWVTTIHGLCGLILREFPEASGFQGEERVLSEPESLRLWREAVERLWFDGRDQGTEEVMALQRLLAREGREGLESILVRARELEGAGLLERCEAPEAGPGLKDFAITAKRVIAAYNELKARAGAIDFGDLEKAARRAVADQEVCRVLQRRFDLVLIDEFQDTNAVQAEILWSVARPDLSNLCVVGDPKQSIYRFRDADVSLFEELCARLPARLSLTANFRSHPSILEFVNRSCAPIFEASSLTYEPLRPGLEGTVDPGTETPPVVRVEIEDPEELGALILQEHARGVPFEEMAVLMRRIRGNEAWIQALSRRGIPVAVGGGGLFWSDPRVQELVSMLRWWCFPGDEMAAVAFLRSPWMGVSDQQIDEWKQHPASLQEFWSSQHPVARLLSPMRRAQVRPAQLITHMCGDPVVGAILEPLLHSAMALGHRLEELSLQGMGFFSVVQRVRESMEAGKREKEVPPPRNRGVLPILTIHASKGLEFERVFIVDLGKKPRASRLPVLFWDRRRGAFLTPRDEWGDKAEKDPGFVEWKAHEQAAQLAESKRQFYVALTRAKKQLVLVCPVLEEGAVEPDPAKAASQEHWRAWVDHFGGSSASTSDFSVKASLAPSQELPAVPPRVRLPSPGLERARHAVTEWTLLSRCERAYVRTVLGAEPETDVETDSEGLSSRGKDPWANSDSPALSGRLSPVEIGKRVHALLEAWARFPSDRQVSRQGLLALEAEVGPRRFAARPVIEWLESTDWLDLEGLSEWPFEWRVGGVSLVGAVDRLVRRGEELWVLDYKVFSSLKEDALAIQLYGPQLELYSGAVAQVTGSLPRAALIQISPEGVRLTEVPLGDASLLEHAQKMALRARELLARPEEGEARPTRQESCRLCPHFEQCQ